MAKTSHDKAAEAALRALLAPREEALRALVAVLNQIDGVNARRAAIEREHDALVASANDALDAAKAAGWRAKELSDFGIVVPRPLAPATAKPAPAQPADHGSHESAEHH